MHYKTEIGQTLKIIVSLIQWNINEDLILQCLRFSLSFQQKYTPKNNAPYHTN